MTSNRLVERLTDMRDFCNGTTRPHPANVARLCDDVLALLASSQAPSDADVERVIGIVRKHDRTHDRSRMQSSVAQRSEAHLRQEVAAAIPSAVASDDVVERVALVRQIIDAYKPHDMPTLLPPTSHEKGIERAARVIAALESTSK